LRQAEPGQKIEMSTSGPSPTCFGRMRVISTFLSNLGL